MIDVEAVYNIMCKMSNLSANMIIRNKNEWLHLTTIILLVNFTISFANLFPHVSSAQCKLMP